MTTTMPIADARYLWGEVDRLKSQVAELQVTNRRVVEDQTSIRDYVATFVTHAQLNAAMCTKVSQANMAANTEKLRTETLEWLAAKADNATIQSLQTTKLDISVYESTTWDFKKLRGALEQNLHDMFAAFAHQIEAQVSTKVSIDDFNHIFNPEANGQKAAIESAATRIANMKEQLESLHEYVSNDRLRQHKVADLNVSVLDLTHKYNASRNSVAQLASTADAMKDKLAAIEASESQIATHVAAVTSDLEHLKTSSELERAANGDTTARLDSELQRHQSMSEKLIQSLEQIQHFTRDTLLKTFDAKLKQISTELRSELDGVSVAQRQYARTTNAHLVKTGEQLAHEMEHVALLDTRLRKLSAHVRDVKDDLDTVKGPLATLATNLREENVTILKEIERSQNESRDLILDYQELLEKEQQLLPSAVAPLRPSSSSVTPRVTSAYASRKHKQQVLAHGRTPPRPHTSHAAATRVPPRLLPDKDSTSSSNPATYSNNAVARAQTAGVAPATRPPQQLQTKGERNLRALDPALELPAATSASMSSRRTSLLQQLSSDCPDDAEPHFHFRSQQQQREATSSNERCE